jgi:DNA-binding MurR/RpiR family transcriptional regulator
VDVVNAIKLARMNGAATIAITSSPQSPLAEQAEILLQTTSQEIPIYGEFLRARIGQLFIVDLLYIGVVFTLGDRARKSLETTAKAIKEFY